MTSPGRATKDQYVITVRGVAGPTVRAAFADLQVTTVGERTVLGDVFPDQAALHGVLQRLQDFGIEVLEVRREYEQAGDGAVSAKGGGGNLGLRAGPSAPPLPEDVS
jgi:hypothetical protein